MGKPKKCKVAGAPSEQKQSRQRTYEIIQGRKWEDYGGPSKSSDIEYPEPLSQSWKQTLTSEFSMTAHHCWCEGGGPLSKKSSCVEDHVWPCDMFHPTLLRRANNCDSCKRSLEVHLRNFRDIAVPIKQLRELDNVSQENQTCSPAKKKGSRNILRDNIANNKHMLAKDANEVEDVMRAFSGCLQAKKIAVSSSLASQNTTTISSQPWQAWLGASGTCPEDEECRALGRMFAAFGISCQNSSSNKKRAALIRDASMTMLDERRSAESEQKGIVDRKIAYLRWFPQSVHGFKNENLAVEDDVVATDGEAEVVLDE